MLEMKNRVVAEWGVSHDVIRDASPVNERQSSGAVRTNRSMIRNHKLALEQSYSKESEADHVAIPWLIMQAAVMVSLFEIGSDGSTAYERSRGKPCREGLLIFGECVCSTFRWSGHEAERTSWKRSFSMECISD